MKVEYTEGCVYYGLSVDEKPYSDLTQEEMKELKKRTFKYLKEMCDENDLQDLLVWTTQRLGYPKFLFHCEECGDDVYSTTIDV